MSPRIGNRIYLSPLLKARPSTAGRNDDTIPTCRLLADMTIDAWAAAKSPLVSSAVSAGVGFARHGVLLFPEFMLQQTQVSRVAGRFDPFLVRSPPLAMVESGEDAVLAKWSGMGYYRRARMLHAAALAIVEKHGGVVPEDAATLETLLGSGGTPQGRLLPSLVVQCAHR